jgi:hypothetical protein
VRSPPTTTPISWTGERVCVVLPQPFYFDCGVLSYPFLMDSGRGGSINHFMDCGGGGGSSYIYFILIRARHAIHNEQLTSAQSPSHLPCSQRPPTTTLLRPHAVHKLPLPDCELPTGSSPPRNYSYLTGERKSAVLPPNQISTSGTGEPTIRRCSPSIGANSYLTGECGSSSFHN